VCSDVAAPTVAKFACARDLTEAHGVATAVLWHDMDSTQSERFGARIVLPAGKRLKGVWLAPRELEDLEPRFIEVERARVEQAVAELATWVHNADVPDRAEATGRVERLRAWLLEADLRTLADVNRALATLLLREGLGYAPPSTFASEMLARGLLVARVEEHLARAAEVVAVFNAALDGLAAADVDPQVRPLPDDHLPLRFSCPRDGTRLRLGAERSGGRLVAAATCRCGTRHAFDLGPQDAPRLDELAATGRWSIDVCMPIHHNELASGWVGGRSTALYGIACNAVLERVFGRTPIPVLVPAGVDGEGETLLVRHLLARDRRADPARA
jgi:hypothetical protein